MKALEVLEFDGVRGILARYITSPLGRGELARLGPSMDRAALEGRFAEIGEARRYLEDAIANERGAARLRFSDLPDVAAPLAKARIEGAVLEPLEIHALTGLLERASEARHVLSAASAHFPLLALRSTAIGEFRGLLADLRGKILPDGTVADDASVALARLRRDKARQQRSIQDSLERFLRAHREDGLLQEQFVTIKNDRFVVPVVTGQQKKVTGVVHGASSSGQTVFLEPLETIELNNDLVRLNEEELREVHRILRELSAKLRAAQEDIARAVGTLAGLEVLFGIADFARVFDCVVPRFSPPEARRLVLKAARHPLLEDVLKRQQKRVVPITLALDEGQRSLLISGPNTGGKTVAMKTVGLLALMAQSGLPVPAEEAEFPIFEHVLADVGDQQSIAESLSSFSSHILHVREMLTEVTRDSLVLLDELGRATDPEEGGALGVALLDWFRSTGAFTLASTHLLALKIYGANTGGVLNASMGFNDATLEPTYVLRTGAPGKSAGIEIAERLGLPEKLIATAKSNLTGAERDIARFLAELHAKLDATAALEGELQTREARLWAREESLKVEWDKKESAKIRELERKFEQTLEEFQAQAEETIDAVKRTTEQKKAAEQARAKTSKVRREFAEQVGAILRPETGIPGALKVAEGARVRLKGIREIARVRRMVGEDAIEVEAGWMKIQVPRSDVVEVLPDAGGGPKLPKGVTVEMGPSWTLSEREINVIGKHAEEACDEVERFLDKASLASVDRVRIVHGHGMGILKRAIGELLKKNPLVEKFYPGSPGEGGTGATIVELKG